MHRVEVLGFECTACRKAYRLIEEVAGELGVSIRLEKVSDPVRIADYRVLCVPGVAVDGRLVYSGGIPDRQTIRHWLA
jgi:predicted thioredoxin/glutaredoxin